MADNYDFVSNSNRQRNKYKDAINGITSAINLLDEALLELNIISDVSDVETLKKQINQKINNLKLQKNKINENRNALPRLALEAQKKAGEI